VSVRATQAML